MEIISPTTVNEGVTILLGQHLPRIASSDSVFLITSIITMAKWNFLCCWSYGSEVEVRGCGPLITTESQLEDLHFNCFPCLCFRRSYTFTWTWQETEPQDIALSILERKIKSFWFCHCVWKEPEWTGKVVCLCVGAHIDRCTHTDMHVCRSNRTTSASGGVSQVSFTF